MRKTLVLLVSFVCALSNAFAQNVDVQIMSGIGISSESLSPTLWLDESNHLYSIPVDVNVNYRFMPTKKIKPFVGSGVKYIANSYNKSVESLVYGYKVNSIIYRQDNLAIPLRVGAIWSVFGNNSIGIHYETQYNVALNAESSYDSDGLNTAIFGTLEYDYQLESRASNFFSNLLSMHLSMQVSTDVFLRTEVSYEWRPVSGEFHYKTSQIQTETNQETGVSTQQRASLTANQVELQNNFIFFKIGLSKII